MSLLGLQELLTRLYTDRAFRQAFRNDPAGLAQPFELDAEDREQLRRLDLSQVERYAAGLRHKRAGYLRERLPVVAAVGGERFSRWRERFLDAAPSAEEGRRDAVAFLRFLMAQAPGDPTLHRPAYLRDLLRFEQIRLELLLAAARTGGDGPSDGGPPALAETSRLAAFRFDFAWLYPRLVTGQLQPVREDPGWLLFGMVADRELRWRRIDARMARLIECCNGERSAEEILDAFQRTAAEAGTIPREEARAALVELTRVGILVGRV